MRPQSHTLVLAGVALALAAGACGPVRFVTSPYAVRELKVVYSKQEQVTFFAWKLAADIDPAAVRFELATERGWIPLVFEKAPFPAGAFDCPGATCFRWSMRGEYQPTLSFTPLRSIHEHHGLIAGPSVFVEEVDTTVALAPRFLPDNRQVELKVDDFAAPAGSALRRNFRWRMTASDGACLPGTGPWDAETRGLETLDFPGEPSDAGRYCVEIQPEPLDGGESVRVAAVALTHPLLFARRASYAPPHEEAPVVYKLLIDLEIPNAARCSETIAKIVERAHELDSGGPAAIALAPLVLSESDGSKCRQQAERQLDVAAVANEVREAIRTRVKQEFGAPVFFIYVNNLAFPLPEPLAAGIAALRDELANEERSEAVLWAIATQPVFVARPNLRWDLETGYASPTTRAFQEIFVDFAELRLPVRTMLHDDSTRVPFIDPELDARPGGIVKLCESTPPVALTLGGIPSRQRAIAFVPSQPVEFAVHLEPQIRLPAGAPDGVLHWVWHTVDLSYEVCTRWCTHPFEMLDGKAGENWNLDDRCRGAVP